MPNWFFKASDCLNNWVHKAAFLSNSVDQSCKSCSDGINKDSDEEHIDLSSLERMCCSREVTTQASLVSQWQSEQYKFLREQQHRRLVHGDSSVLDSSSNIPPTSPGRSQPKNVVNRPRFDKQRKRRLRCMGHRVGFPCRSSHTNLVTSRTCVSGDRRNQSSVHGNATVTTAVDDYVCHSDDSLKPLLPVKQSLPDNRAEGKKKQTQAVLADPEDLIAYHPLSHTPTSLPGHLQNEFTKIQQQMVDVIGLASSQGATGIPVHVFGLAFPYEHEGPTGLSATITFTKTGTAFVIQENNTSGIQGQRILQEISFDKVRRIDYYDVRDAQTDMESPRDNGSVEARTSLQVSSASDNNIHEFSSQKNLTELHRIHQCNKQNVNERWSCPSGRTISVETANAMKKVPIATRLRTIQKEECQMDKDRKPTYEKNMESNKKNRFWIVCSSHEWCNILLTSMQLLQMRVRRASTAV
eukprot:GHVQ01000295.1.p1 GENE.GHVQ01000295.1~~GHVQ01000295.1.p1  ORF type:complete len:468 (+),score=58.40 GHVQ01000295.1:647-2050(+)